MAEKVLGFKEKDAIIMEKKGDAPHKLHEERLVQECAQAEKECEK